MGMRPASESETLAQCLELLRLRGVPCWRQNCGGMRVGGRYVPFTSSPGISDIIGVVPSGPEAGKILCVECKAPGGTVRPSQRAFLDAVSNAKGVCAVVTDVRELDALLTDLGVS